MATVQQKAQCVLWYAEFKSIITVQRHYRRIYGQDAPTDKTIIRWFNKFKETGSLDIKKSPGRPPTSEENVERLRQSCIHNPNKSIARRSLELGIPKTTIQNVLHKRLKLHAYKIQLNQHEIKPGDHSKHIEFAEQQEVLTLKHTKARSTKRKTEDTESKSSKKTKKEEKSEKINDDNLVESDDFTSDAKSSAGKKWNIKISSWNVNGIRAWLDKGITFLTEENPDILCLQETKCGDEEIPKDIKDFEGYEKYWLSSDQKGYSGVGLLTKKKPLNVTYGIGIKEHDKEGRVITAEYEEFYLVNVYVPNAGRKLIRLDYRMKWNEDFLEYLKKLEAKKPLILCGDLNVAHNEIDLARPKSNKKNAGFTKEEREDFTKLLSEGFFDSFRKLYPDEEGCYTFWSYMMNARGKDIGWRLDYFVLSEKLEQNLCDNIIRKKILGSDHCPITLLMSF